MNNSSLWAQRLLMAATNPVLISTLLKEYSRQYEDNGLATQLPSFVLPNDGGVTPTEFLRLAAPAAALVAACSSNPDILALCRIDKRMMVLESLAENPNLDTPTIEHILGGRGVGGPHPSNTPSFRSRYLPLTDLLSSSEKEWAWSVITAARTPEEVSQLVQEGFDRRGSVAFLSAAQMPWAQVASIVDYCDSPQAKLKSLPNIGKAAGWTVPWDLDSWSLVLSWDAAVAELGEEARDSMPNIDWARYAGRAPLEWVLGMLAEAKTPALRLFVVRSADFRCAHSVDLAQNLTVSEFEILLGRAANADQRSTAANPAVEVHAAKVIHSQDRLAARRLFDIYKSDLGPLYECGRHTLLDLLYLACGAEDWKPGRGVPIPPAAGKWLLREHSLFEVCLKLATEAAIVIRTEAYFLLLHGMRCWAQSPESQDLRRHQAHMRRVKHLPGMSEIQYLLDCQEQPAVDVWNARRDPEAAGGLLSLARVFERELPDAAESDCALLLELLPGWSGTCYELVSTIKATS